MLRSSTPLNSIPSGEVYRGLQAVRAIAAVMVVVEHTMLYVRERLDPSVVVWDGGRLGVYAFFVISGFVMQLAVQQPRSPSWQMFAVRRVIRIVPLYWILTSVKVLVLALAPAVVLHAALSPRVVWLSYAFLPSRNIDGKVVPLLGVGWTLEMEMLFYALVTLALATRVNPMTLCALVTSVLTICHVVRGDSWPAWAFYGDPIVLFFLAGMALAKWTADHDNRRLLLWFTWIIALWCFAWTLQAPDDAVSDFARIAKSIAVLVTMTLVVAAEPWLHRRVPRWLEFLGDATYAIYLSHPFIAPGIPVALGLLGLGGAGWIWAGYGAAVVVTFAVGVVLHVTVERPITARLRRAVSRARDGGPDRNARLEVVDVRSGPAHDDAR